MVAHCNRHLRQERCRGKGNNQVVGDHHLHHWAATRPHKSGAVVTKRQRERSGDAVDGCKRPGHGGAVAAQVIVEIVDARLARRPRRPELAALAGVALLALLAILARFALQPWRPRRAKVAALARRARVALRPGWPLGARRPLGPFLAAAATAAPVRVGVAFGCHLVVIDRVAPGRERPDHAVAGALHGTRGRYRGVGRRLRRGLRGDDRGVSGSFGRSRGRRRLLGDRANL